MNPSINTDILVIGSGLSGATAAITAADAGKYVTIITLGSISTYSIIIRCCINYN